MALTLLPYQRAVGLLESLEPRGMKPGLERTEALLQALGEPHRGLRGVLVAGTNGKGSVCATIESIARAAGLRTVMLTKPHLRTYCERIAVDGVAVSSDRFAETVQAVWDAASSLPDDVQPTAFEMLTAAGLLVARQESPDVVICEVGLGGRLDSTNVVDLGVAVVTNVGLDHTDRLGDTLEAIAGEKAGIIKSGDTTVTGAEEPALSVIAARSRELGAPLRVVSGVEGKAEGFAGVQLHTTFAGETIAVRAPLIGDFQVSNIATAVAVCDVLREQGFGITADAVIAGCARVQWPGRMQWFDLRPGVLVDGAHNPPGIAALVRAARPLVGSRRTVAVFAAMRDKDVISMAAQLQRLHADAVVVTAPDVPRSTPPDELAALFTTAMTASSTRTALEQARLHAGDDGVVVVCGSLYLAGEALEVLEPV